MDNKEKKNEQDMINTQVEPHNHRAIIGFDKNGCSLSQNISDKAGCAGQCAGPGSQRNDAAYVAAWI